MRKLPFTILVLSLLGNVFLLYKILATTSGVGNEAQETASDYYFLSKRIFAEDQNDILINFTALRTSLRNYIGASKSPVGLYFEYLPSGVSIGINDGLEVHLASLIKIPIVMAIYKEMERGAIRPDKRIAVKKEHLDKRYGELWKVAEGAKISVREAIELALTQSDNTASNVLLHSVPSRRIDDVFDSLDVPKKTEGNLHVISPKSYSSIIRSLYLSSYLTKRSSNELLKLLIQTQFADGLPAGVPKEIKVAHKVGIFDLRNVPEKTYSDCGIVYLPKRPYILCLMVQDIESEAVKRMSEISKTVYDYVSSANPPSPKTE
jgi:beta-lactamase class A